MMKTYIKRIPFPLGATVVGIVSIMFGIYLVTMCSLYLSERENLVEEFCTNVTLNNDSHRLDVTISHLCRKKEIVMYSMVAALVNGCLLLICAVMLVIGVWKDSGTLLAPYLILMGLEIFLAFAGGVALSVTLAKELMVRVIISAVFVLATPIYFWMVVFYHMLGTRHNFVAEGTPDGMVVRAPKKVSNPSTSSTVHLLIEDEPTFPNTPSALEPATPIKDPPPDHSADVSLAAILSPKKSRQSPILEEPEEMTNGSTDIENMLQPEQVTPSKDLSESVNEDPPLEQETPETEEVTPEAAEDSVDTESPIVQENDKIESDEASPDKSSLPETPGEQAPGDSEESISREELPGGEQEKNPEK